MIKKIFAFFIFALLTNQSHAEENLMLLKLKDGDVIIELFEGVAPNHVKRFKKLSSEKKYGIYIPKSDDFVKPNNASSRSIETCYGSKKLEG